MISIKRTTLKILIMTAAAMSISSCSKTIAITDPCDVLVKMTPLEASARYLVTNDRSLAQAIASHKGRYKQFKCGD